jgi:flagellar hook-associated protein 3 FlgL
MAMEIAELKNQLGNVANQMINGRYIFAGTDTLNPPYDAAAGDFVSTNSSQFNLEVSQNMYVAINANGQNIFNYPNNGSNIFKVLDNIIQDLNNGNSAMSHNAALQQQYENILAERAALGARVNRIELVLDRLDKQEVNVTELMSKNEDADEAEVITDLKTQESIHRAALSAGARIIQPTLIDFLR